MAGENNDIVEDVERVVLPGSEGEPTDDTEETAADAADDAVEETETGEPSAEVTEEPIVTPSKKTEAVVTEEVPVGAENVKRVPGETDREYAFRKEIASLKRQRRQEQVAEITGEVVPPNTPAKKAELNEDQKKILGKYKPEELNGLREVLPIIASEMGFVRADELSAKEFASETDKALSNFIEKHPEYTPEKDPDNVMWGRFKQEFGRYKQPASPKEYSSLFEKIHRDIFGIEPARELPKETAARTKVALASHAGAPASPGPRTSVHRSAAPSGLRTDMLKGFDDSEIDEIVGGGE